MNKISIVEKLRSYSLPTECVIFVMFVITWMTYDRKYFIVTFPLIIIIPFILRLLFDNSWLIVATAFISSISTGMIKDDLGYGIFFVIGILTASFSGTLLAKGIRSENKKKRMILTVIGLTAVILSGLNYAETWGTPVGYLKAKQIIEDYIDKTYDGKLKIESVERSFLKWSGYYAHVSEEGRPRNKSMIEYYEGQRSISDTYHSQVNGNMMDQVSNMLTSLVVMQTDLTDYEVNLYAKFEIPEGKYRLNDHFLGDEPINVDIQLQPDFNWKREDNKKIEVKVYKDETDFAEDAYKIIKVLQNTGYQYQELRVYYFLEDGNTTYEVVLKEGGTVDADSELLGKVQKVDYSKEKKQ